MLLVSGTHRLSFYWLGDTILPGDTILQGVGGDDNIRTRINIFELVARQPIGWLLQHFRRNRNLEVNRTMWRLQTNKTRSYTVACCFVRHRTRVRYCIKCLLVNYGQRNRLHRIHSILPCRIEDCVRILAKPDCSSAVHWPLRRRYGGLQGRAGVEEGPNSAGGR